MRAKTLLVGGTALAGAVALIAGSQTWVSFELAGVSGEEAVSGHEANAAATPVSLALVAAALALTIAGPAFRRVLGVLVALLGFGAAALAIGVLVDPVAAASGRITELTGIAGGSGGTEASGIGVAFWVYVAVAAGAAAVVLGIAVLVTSGRWGAAGRKYESAPKRGIPKGGDRISDWDALSQGEDPTTPEN